MKVTEPNVSECLKFDQVGMTDKLYYYIRIYKEISGLKFRIALPVIGGLRGEVTVTLRPIRSTRTRVCLNGAYRIATATCTD